MLGQLCLQDKALCVGSGQSYKIARQSLAGDLCYRDLYQLRLAVQGVSVAGTQYDVTSVRNNRDRVVC